MGKYSNEKEVCENAASFFELKSCSKIYFYVFYIEI